MTEHTTPEAQPKTITLRIPKLNMQVTVLALIALVSLFQTVQLLSLKAKAGGITVKAPSSGSATPATQGGTHNNSALPGMVGGC